MRIRTIAKKTLPILVTLALTTGCSFNISNIKTKVLGTKYTAPTYDRIFSAKGQSSKSENGLEVFAAKYKDKNMYKEKRPFFKAPINELTYGWEIILKNADGFKRLTNNSVQEFYPKISQDGTYVIFERRDKTNKNSDVYKIDLETMTETKLTDKGTCEKPVISPDGKTIAYNYQGNIYTMDQDGKNQKELLNLNVDVKISEWNKQGLVFTYGDSMHPNAIIDFERKEVKDYNPGN